MAERKHTHSARGPLIAVLLVVLVVFSWYLFGGKFMEKIQEDRANDVENVDPAPVDPTPVDPTPVDPTPDEPTPVVNPSWLRRRSEPAPIQTRAGSVLRSLQGGKITLFETV